MLVSIALSLLLVTSALASPSDTPQGYCGTETTTPSQIADTAAALKAYRLENNGIVFVRQDRDTIDAYFHVISKGTSVDDGNVLDSTISQLITLVQSSFISLGVTWNFLPTSHTVNADWYSHVRGSTNDVAMKASFFDEENHFSNTLHIYIVGSINVSSDNVDGNKGYATYPQAYNGDPTLDGVVLANSAIPGGSDPNYNQGKALIHEMGHWFGLYHTFEGGCTEPNDQIPDTPQERYPGFCSEKDSCPDNAGSDPIHNFMDYGYDSCINEFTQGQINQMNDLRRLYRHGTPVQ